MNRAIVTNPGGRYRNESDVARQSIVHVITALGPGGAEVVLSRLASRQHGGRFDHVVVSLRDYGADPRADLESAGVRVIPLGAKPGTLDPRLVSRLARVLRQERPAAVQTWMYHADLIGGLAAKLAGSPPVAWNIRNGTLAPEFSKPMTLKIAALNARLSRVLPSVIVCCAESAKQIHVDHGYPAERIAVIPNGYDLDQFKPNPEARRRIRNEFRIPEIAPVIGLAARFHPQKDHGAFFKAARIVADARPDVYFLLCGEDVNDKNVELAAMIDAAGVRDRCRLAGQRSDMPDIHASIDIASLTSRGGEGFPNAIGEAMATGATCVVTDVGDAALMVGDTGRVAQSGDVAELAAGMLSLLGLRDEERGALGHRARQRIAARYDIGQFHDRYEALYQQLANRESTSRLVLGASD